MLQRLFPFFLLAFSLPTLAMCPADSVPQVVADSVEDGRGITHKLKRTFRSLDRMDTTYISPNYYNYTAMLQNTNFYQFYSLSAPKSDDHPSQFITLSPRTAFKVGPYFGWRWIFLGYTFDVGRPSQAGKSTEFALSLYSAKIGVDYLSTRSTGDFTFQRIGGFDNVPSSNVRGTKFGGMKAKGKKLNIYYIFNSKRFSYPAAFNQSTVQRKSAGSWKIGFRYDEQSIRFDGEQLPTEMRVNLNPALKELKLDQATYSISFGYAYNWVIAHNCLLAGSISPALGYTHSKGESFTGRKLFQSIQNNLTNFDCITRLGFVYNNSRWFIGASVIHYLYNYHQETYSISNSVLYANFYIGFNFFKRRKYRKDDRPSF